jgi:spore coat polysaccharide biosynthesis protein SpsF
MTRNVVAIIQARMGASRLPNKMMLHLHGFPVVEWIYKRVSKSTLVDDVVFAIPDTEKDDVLEYYLKNIGANVFRGSEADVLERFYQCAIEYKPTHILRVCADNPLISPKALDTLITEFFKVNADYVYNHLPKNNLYPDGLGAEMVSIELLTKVYNNAKILDQREHIFNYIWQNADQFTIHTFDPPDPMQHHPELKLDLDVFKDYLFLLSRNIYPDMSDNEIVKIFLEKS